MKMNWHYVKFIDAEGEYHECQLCFLSRRRALQSLIDRGFNGIRVERFVDIYDELIRALYMAGSINATTLWTQAGGERWIKQK